MSDELRQDAAEALRRMKTKVLRSARRAISVLLEDLEPGENVLRLAGGYVRTSGVQQSGILALTNRRIQFIHAGVILSQKVSVPLDTVTGVAVSKGAFYSSIKTTGAQSNVVVERVGKADAEDFASELRSLLANRSQASTQAPNLAGVDVVSELERPRCST
jgi:hypothetical protein